MRELGRRGRGIGAEPDDDQYKKWSMPLMAAAFEADGCYIRFGRRRKKIHSVDRGRLWLEEV